MIIQHTTYDEARIQKSSMARRASDLSNALRGFVSSKTSRNSSDSVSLRQNTAEWPVTLWPVLETKVSPQPKTFVTDKIESQKKQNRNEKHTRKEVKCLPPIPSNQRDNYFTLQNVTYQRPAAPRSDLSRKRRVSTAQMKAKVDIKSSESLPPGDDSTKTIDQLHKMRQAMKHGKMEQVIPPSRNSQSPTTGGRLIPPPKFSFDYSPRTSNDSSRGGSSSYQTSSESKRHSERSRKSKSSSRKLADYIRTSASILDEKRRDVQSKLQAPFENISHSLLSRNASNASINESFWCIGDERPLEETKPQRNTQQKKNESKGHKEEKKPVVPIQPEKRHERRAEEAPWAAHPPEHCKICHKFTSLNIQELCQECMALFNNPQESAQSSKPNSDSEWEDDLRLSEEEENEIKPTPPLKDRNTLSMRKSPTLSAHIYYQSVTEDKRGVVPLKDMGLRPIFNPVPEQSKPKTYSFEYDGEGGFLDWDTAVRRDEEVSPLEENDQTPLIKRKKRGNVKEPVRNTEFYRFYDDVLGTR